MRYLAALAVAALVLASNAGAGIYVKAVQPSRAHVGGLLRVRISAGLRLWERIPVYIVASSSADRINAVATRSANRKSRDPRLQARIVGSRR